VKANKLFNFAVEVKSEANRVLWPSIREVAASSLLVFVVVGVASLFFLAVDGAAYKSVNYILKLGG